MALPIRPARLPALALHLLLAPLAAADEGRFDPPLEGVFLGLQAEARDGGVLVRVVERGSAADRAGLKPGDVVARLGPSGGFAGMEDFTARVRGLRRGEPVAVEVAREGQRATLTLVPDPAVLRDFYRLLDHLRDSGFLRSRQGFEAALREMETSVPAALRGARYSSEAHEILNGALRRLGTSHTSIIPPWTYENLLASEQDGDGGHALGLLLERTQESGRAAYFVAEVLDRSPAQAAGLLAGDEVLRVEGVDIDRSPRRALAGFEADRRRYTIQVDPGEAVALHLRRERGGPEISARLTADLPVSGYRSSAASLRWIESGGRRLAYLHLWNLLSPRLPALVQDAVAPEADLVEGLVLDLRGRGGNVAVMNRVVRILRRARIPCALLIDRETRSAKEILAHQLKGSPGVVLVGERTAGAVLPGSYRRLPSGAMLMLPGDPRSIRELTGGEGLEGKGVAPDLEVARAGPYGAGRDPILEAGIRAVLGELAAVPRRRRA